MFEFMNLMNFGREITAQGEKWQSIQMLQNRYHLAVKIGDKLPTQCYVVREDEKPKEESSNVELTGSAQLETSTRK